MVNLQDLITETIKSQRHDKEQRHWNISRLGNCMTGQYLERMGKEPDEPFDDRTLRVFSVGNVFEDWIASLLKEKAEVQTQVHVEDQALDVSGYADLVAQFDDQQVVYEFKTVHSGAFWWMFKGGVKYGKQVEASGPKPLHLIQLWMYLYLTKIPMGILVYISKDDLTIKECPVLLSDEKLKAKALGILATLNEAWQSKQVPPPSSQPEDAWFDKYCSWHKQCKVYAQEVLV